MRLEHARIPEPGHAGIDVVDGFEAAVRYLLFPCRIGSTDTHKTAGMDRKPKVSGRVRPFLPSQLHIILVLGYRLYSL
jgi:hypothetical protein